MQQGRGRKWGKKERKKKVVSQPTFTHFAILRILTRSLLRWGNSSLANDRGKACNNEHGRKKRMKRIECDDMSHVYNIFFSDKSLNLSTSKQSRGMYEICAIVFWSSSNLNLYRFFSSFHLSLRTFVVVAVAAAVEMIVGQRHTFVRQGHCAWRSKFLCDFFLCSDFNFFFS